MQCGNGLGSVKTLIHCSLDNQCIGFTIKMEIFGHYGWSINFGIIMTTKDKQITTKSYTIKIQVRIQPKGTAAPSSNPSDHHLVLDPLIKTLVARTKANASRAHNHLITSP